MTGWAAAEGISELLPTKDRLRALITGAGGFVGWHVTQAFEHAGFDVLGVDVPGKLWGPGFPEDPVDIVVSLAATADPWEALRDPVAAYANSARIMLETMRYAQETGARVLHVSTNEVYGDRNGPVYAPRGPYAGAKATQELICGTYPDVPTTIVVTQSLFGENQQPNKLIPTAIRLLLAGEPVTLQHDGDRWAARPFMHARNLAEALVWLTHHPGQNRVHVGASEVMPVIDVVSILAKALGVKLRVHEVPAGDRAGHETEVEPIGCDIDGWQPRYGTVEALQNVARWYAERPF